MKILSYQKGFFYPKRKMEIKIYSSGAKISLAELKILAENYFGDMVKGVVDISSGDLALGGDLHSDQETLLLEKGSDQKNLWGINLYIDLPHPIGLNSTRL